MDRVSAKNAQDSFCRRFSHQSTVIGDRLYVDGGYLNFNDFPGNPENRTNTGLGYHDLRRPASSDKEQAFFPEFKIGLNKTDDIPSVAGGVLWPDSVNEKFYLYGGERMDERSADPYRTLSYDTKNDRWDDLGSPSPIRAPNISSFGAGVGVSQTGYGYYYGGWISATSMSGWSRDRTMSSNFYSYNYDTNEFTSPNSPDDYPRAEGGMVWIPVGDPKGLLVYLGGVVSLNGNDTSPQPLNEILIFDPATEKWHTQNTTGLAPQNRRQFCMDVSWPADRSSFNIYLFGGRAVYPPLTNESAYSDVYVLSLPTFNWTKIDPATPGNATGKTNNRYGSSCNMIKDRSQLFIIGGTFAKHNDCDSEGTWGGHNLWTAMRKDPSGIDSYWLGVDDVDTNDTVPAVIYNTIDGGKDGGATDKSPKNGFSSPDLKTLFSRKWVDPGRKPADTSGGSKLGTGAIVGIAIGGAVVLALIGYLWYRFGKRVVQRREQRHQSQVIQQAQQMQQAQGSQQMQHAQLAQQPFHQSVYGSSTFGTQSLVTPHTPSAQWELGSPPASPALHPPMEPTELPADHDNGARENKPPDYSRVHHVQQGN